MEFRPNNRSTIDNIFMVRQIYEKCHEYNIDLHNTFIDFSQAFVTVNRDVIYNSLSKHNVPDKLIKLIKPTMQQTKMKVKVNNSYCCALLWYQGNILTCTVIYSFIKCRPKQNLI